MLSWDQDRVFRPRDQDRDLGHQVSRPRPGQNGLECTQVSRAWSRDHNTDVYIFFSVAAVDFHFPILPIKFLFFPPFLYHPIFFTNFSRHVGTLIYTTRQTMYTRPSGTWNTADDKRSIAFWSANHSCRRRLLRQRLAVHIVSLLRLYITFNTSITNVSVSSATETQQKPATL